MSETKHNSGTGPREHDPAAHRRDVNIRGIMTTGAALVGIMIFSAVFLYFLFNYYEGDVAKGDIAPSPVEDTTALPPLPRLQANELTDLVALRRSEDSLLASGGWVDSSLGIARIPIDSAIEIIARTGKIPQMGTAPAPPVVPDSSAPRINRQVGQSDDTIRRR